jgi:hypothetical protein
VQVSDAVLAETTAHGEPPTVTTVSLVSSAPTSVMVPPPSSAHVAASQLVDALVI